MLRIMKKSIGITIICFVILVCVGLVANHMFGAQYKSAMSITQVREGLYTLTYKGDMGLQELLDQGGSSSSSETAAYISKFLSRGFMDSSEPDPLSYGCSTLTVKLDDGSYFTGRNFDWFSEPGDVAIVRCVPKNGYQSISTCFVPFLGFPKDFKPDNMVNRMIFLSTAYVPLDGMNEKGLAVATLSAGDPELVDQHTGRTNITTTLAIRLLLDRAATVDEAITILQQFDMHSESVDNQHLFISDADGSSVVVEWLDDDMFVAESPICANHYITDCRKKGYTVWIETPVSRFDRLARMYEESPVMTRKQAQESIFSVMQPNTFWTITYDRETLTATYYFGGDTNRPYCVPIF